jgi:hypothetical protein
VRCDYACHCSADKDAKIAAQETNNVAVLEELDNLSFMIAVRVGITPGMIVEKNELTVSNV